MMHLPSYAERVVDADEEVFILYTELQSIAVDDTAFRGLGYVDNHKELVEINFEIEEELPTGQNQKKPKRRASSSVNIELFQDRTALYSRKGDTGSVLWKASVDFAHAVLKACHNILTDTLLPRDWLAERHILELGAGTGLLSVALSPLVHHYTATDLPDLVPLLRKNVAHNNVAKNVTVDDLDWIYLQKLSTTQRAQAFSFRHPIDIILAVDCLYHPTLIPGFVETLDYLTAPGKTLVVIVCELRSDEVTRDFLQAWITRAPEWEIYRIPGFLGGPYVVWAGYKKVIS